MLTTPIPSEKSKGFCSLVVDYFVETATGTPIKNRSTSNDSTEVPAVGLLKI